jgi:hypothetical protein
VRLRNFCEYTAVTTGGWRSRALTLICVTALGACYAEVALDAGSLTLSP